MLEINRSENKLEWMYWNFLVPRRKWSVKINQDYYSVPLGTKLSDKGVRVISSSENSCSMKNEDSSNGFKCIRMSFKWADKSHGLRVNINSQVKWRRFENYNLISTSRIAVGSVSKLRITHLASEFGTGLILPERSFHYSNFCYFNTKSR